jgi:benzylsuccinate CoA-transferase BbsE subunit
MLPYSNLRVVEVGGSIAAEFTGRLMARMGADVVKIEPPEGSATRSVGPFAQGRDDGEHSLPFWYHNTNKRSVVCDHPSSEGATLRGLLAEADVCLLGLTTAELAANGLQPAELGAEFERLIVVAFTPFGLHGPWAEYLTSDLVALAAGGVLHTCGYDDHSLPPIRPPEHHASYTTASFAHQSVLLALLERRRSGRGQVLDVSMHDCLALSPEIVNPYWFYPKVVLQRQTARSAQPTLTQPSHFLCRDGRYVLLVLLISYQKPWDTLVEWLDSHGLAADLLDEQYGDLQHRQRNFPHIQGILEAFFLLGDADARAHDGAALGLPIFTINAPEEVLQDRHLNERQAFETLDHDDSPAGRYPAVPYRFSAFTPRPLERAPRLGEHNEEVDAGARQLSSTE